MNYGCMCAAPGVGWYYSSHGWYNSSCKVSQCETDCNTGLYRSGCSGNSTGDCVACTNGPQFSTYSTKGNLISDCAWNCNAGYIRSDQTCVVNSACTKEIPTNSVYSDTNYPNCNHQCNAGYFGTPVTNPVSCAACLTGTFSVQGETVCTACAAGTFSTVPTSPSINNCQNCDAGTYSASTGASLSSACIRCQAGTYSGSTGSVVCEDCPTGTSSAIEGANSFAVCSACAAGKFTNTSASIACSTCGAGTFSPSGATKCFNCAPDTYASSSGMGGCLPCAICNTPGIYRYGCGPVSTGACISCSNPAV